jgi:hypothetical protein
MVKSVPTMELACAALGVEVTSGHIVASWVGAA